MTARAEAEGTLNSHRRALQPPPQRTLHQESCGPTAGGWGGGAGGSGIPTVNVTHVYPLASQRCSSSQDDAIDGTRRGNRPSPSGHPGGPEEGDPPGEMLRLAVPGRRGSRKRRGARLSFRLSSG